MKVHSAATLGEILRDRRVELDRSQRDVAQEVGVSRKWIIDVERGKPTVTFDLVLRLLDSLELDLDLVPRRPSDATTDRDSWPDTVTVDLDELLRAHQRRGRT
ncbi:MAG TPA: helix-turn-helix domain-containing protein [Acidimicrobiales bacterium]|nr:helix-turn-helix domain-containing protein [Acidimicrobiales bacterium]